MLLYENHGVWLTTIMFTFAKETENTKETAYRYFLQLYNYPYPLNKQNDIISLRQVPSKNWHNAIKHLHNYIRKFWTVSHCHSVLSSNTGVWAPAKQYCLCSNFTAIIACECIHLVTLYFELQCNLNVDILFVSKEWLLTKRETVVIFLYNAGEAGAERICFISVKSHIWNINN